MDMNKKPEQATTKEIYLKIMQGSAPNSKCSDYPELTIFEPEPMY